MSYKWSDSKSKDVAKCQGRYPYQFIFDQDESVFHHKQATSRNKNFQCSSDGIKADSDMIFAAALSDTLNGEKTPCPHCLSKFPTSLDEVLPEHIPDTSKISYSELSEIFG